MSTRSHLGSSPVEATVELIGAGKELPLLTALVSVVPGQTVPDAKAIGQEPTRIFMEPKTQRDR
ncbi:hypothetical protein [Fuerstiella marisgermanici]|uniref:Uncharacterized protein n=1 Tax=Fuerstiella marisgermanici TaxID=1891926 RepID=A0A1P8WEB7_9PLAN|nr:hypothetical protein [Fuerstiella marisgermanici]APZ92414.1 hypothetical protein Fuma_02025 [Fuerstiella marisgermanici]